MMPTNINYRTIMMTDEPSDEEIEACLAELANLKDVKPLDPLQPLTDEEIDTYIGDLSEFMIEDGPSPVAQQAIEAGRVYVLKQNRSQLIRDLESACASAEAVGDPIVKNLLGEALAHMRRHDEGDSSP
jgi:hypothetical protein